jgi:hypothetical protein
VDTYAYFGEPVYIYSLKDGINDGFLTPFKVRQISTTLDEYVYTPDDYVMEGEVQYGKIYQETDFNKIIEIKEREAHRVKLFMDMIDQREKTLVFCASQAHALAVRVQEKGKDQTGRRQSPHHPAHDGDKFLAPRRYSDVGTAIHGNALRQTARFFQERRGTPCPLEYAGYTREAITRSCRERVWPEPDGRDAENH